MVRKSMTRTMPATPMAIRMRKRAVLVLLFSGSFIEYSGKRGDQGLTHGLCFTNGIMSVVPTP
jgi:hypothetical protein